MEFANYLNSKFNFKYNTLVTGDSLGQVSSQTSESLTTTINSSNIFVARPLIGMYKDEIIRRAIDLKTYEISILEGDDMCSNFTPTNPVIKPNLEIVNNMQNELQDFNKIYKNIFSNFKEIITIKHVR